MRRNLLHALVFFAVFVGMLWYLENDAKRTTVGARNPRPAVRVWGPADSAMVDSLIMWGIDRASAHALFSDARFGVDAGVVARFETSRRAPKDSVKRARPYAWLFTDSSVARGKRFLAEYEAFLDSVAQPFGVPPHVIAAILRTETNFGSYPGSYRVVNALYTAACLMEDSSDRRAELREVFALMRIMEHKGLDTLFALKGSWRGAFGLPQFRPSSYLAFAVDGDGDGAVDLFVLPDAVASASNYLQAHGWSHRSRDQWRALYAYNRRAYADAILSYAARISAE